MQAEQLVQWNQWYDRAPPDWRFQVVLWPLLALGAINLLLTVWVGFPFALLVVLGIAFVAAVRVPYVLGWVVPGGGTVVEGSAPAMFQIEGANWIVDLNRRYDALPEIQRFLVFPAILLIAGAINMMLTISRGFPFGLLFLLALLILVGIRAPYAAGWFRTSPTSGIGPIEPQPSKVEHAPMTSLASPLPVTAPASTSPASGAHVGEEPVSNGPDGRHATGDREAE